MYSKNDKIKIILKFIGTLIMYSCVINFILLTNFLSINALHIADAQHTVERTIAEYNELDLNHLCIITNCSKIGFLENRLYESVNNILKPIPYKKPIDILYHTNNVDMTIDLELVAYITKYNMVIVLNTEEMLNEVLYGYLYINIFFIILFGMLFVFIEYKSNRRRMLDILSTSNMLREKNMQILTENIHHELNTPVAIIHGNIRQLEIKMDEEVNVCSECLKKFYFDFGQIYSSIDQIDTVLQRMSNFKNLKYSNGNKTLHDIVSYSANSMSIYKNSNFQIDMDPQLLNFHLHGQLKNGDLLNIVSNHFRNSIEAKSSRIITQVKYDELYNMMHLYIIDNGTGLRDSLTGLPLSRDKYQDIFKPYYTSKDELGKSTFTTSKGLFNDLIIKINSLLKPKKKMKNNARGVGLYLNKELLNEKGGDLILRETTSRGTVFEIIFPVKRKIKKD